MRTRALPALVGIVAIFLAALPAGRIAAQSTVPTVASGYHAPTAEPSPPALVGVTERPFVGIALQDAVTMALLRNPDLAVSAGNVRIARFDVMESKAPFDVQLHLEPSSSFSVTPPLNLFFSGPGEVGEYTCHPFIGPPYPCATEGPGNVIQHEYSFAGGIAGQSVSGTTYAAGITRTRTYNNTLINLFNPSYQSSLNLSATQPLLRNLGMNAAKRAFKLSLTNADENEAEALLDASNTIAQVDDTYWDLVAAWCDVAIQEDALKEAITQQRSTVRLAKGGVAPPIAAVETQTQVSNFQDAVFSALENVADLQNRLKGLIVSDPKDPIWSANLVPSSPVQELPSAGDLATIVQLAQQYRPEIRLARDQRRQADLDHAYAKNQELPQADIQASYQSNGFAGVLAPVPGIETNQCTQIPTGQCPTPPPETQGKMGTATANMWAWRYPTFNIALIFNIPLHNEVARSLVQQSAQEQEQAAISMQGVEMRIGAEARNALQVYQSSLSRLYAARQSRVAAEAVYASEVRKFNSGGSTTFLVLQRQVELAQARGRELRAQTDLNKAVVELQRVEGTILTANGVNLQTLGSKALTH